MPTAQQEQHSISSLPEPTTYAEEDLQWDDMFHYYSTSDPTFEQRLPHVFRHLVTPNVSESFLVSWTENIRNTLIVHLCSVARLKRSPGWPMLHKNVNHRFVTLCASNGVIATMFDVSRLKVHQYNSASYMAIEIISNICQSVDEPTRMDIHKVVLAKNGFYLLLNDFTNSHTFAQRAAAVECIEKLLSFTPLGDHLTTAEIANLLSAAASYNLRNHQHVVHDLEKPENSYMQETITYTDGTGESPPSRFRYLSKILQVAPLWFSNSQEIALMACKHALSRKSGVTRRDCFEIMKKPKVVDHLVAIASSPRPISSSGRVSDSIAAELLCYLTMLVPFMPPSTQPPQGADPEIQAVVQCNKVLCERLDLIQMLVHVQNKISSEDLIQVQMKIYEQWKALGDPGMTKFSTAKLSPARGKLRICTLYIFNIFTSIPQVPTHLILSLLPTAYVACARVPTEADCEAAMQNPNGGFKQKSEREERHLTEIVGLPTRLTSPGPGGPFLDCTQFYIPPETILGPTLLFGLLARLGVDGYTPDVLRELKVIPPDFPSIDTLPISLVHIHQIVEPRVLGKLIRLSVSRRIPMRRELGNKLLTTEPELARVTYISALQLAYTIADFGRYPSISVTDGVKENMDWIRRSYQEVILCSGNACEAAAKMKDWDLAKSYADSAIRRCESFPIEEAAAIGWDIELSKQKNLRRWGRILKELRK